MISIFKLVHQNKTYIGIQKQMPEKEWQGVVNIKGIKISKHYDCFVLPYTSQHYKRLLRVGAKIEVTSSATAESRIERSANHGIESKDSITVISTKQDADIKERGNSKARIQWSGNHFYVHISYSTEETKFLKDLEKSYWSKEHRNWVIRATLKNLKALQDRFNGFSESQFSTIQNLLLKKKHPQRIEIYQTPEFPKSVLIRLSGYGIDFNYMKQVSGRNYDKEEKRWIIANEEKVINRIISHYASLGVRIVNRLRSGNIDDYAKRNMTLTKKKEQLIKKFKPPIKLVLEKYVNRMLLEKYGWRTINSYTGKFAKFLAYFDFQDPDSLSAEEVNLFLVDLVNQEVSESLHNMYLSAIKLYYSQVAYNEDFKIERLVRPKQGRYLPTILSTGEVDRMFRTLSNTKHLAICYTIYSGGLRLSEILNLRMEDILWDRNQLFIRKGKGNKDRCTLLGNSLKEVLRLYVEEFKPIYWLFEGSDKRSSYSESSVQKIIRKSARSAGISRRVTPHTLRHCFATHLLDKGTDIRYIQELLGHRDIKTTLVYTHVTTRSIEQIKSPLDQLMEQRVLKKQE